MLVCCSKALIPPPAAFSSGRDIDGTIVPARADYLTFDYRAGTGATKSFAVTNLYLTFQPLQTEG